MLGNPISGFGSSLGFTGLGATGVAFTIIPRAYMSTRSEVPLPFTMKGGETKP